MSSEPCSKCGKLTEGKTDGVPICFRCYTGCDEQTETCEECKLEYCKFVYEEELKEGIVANT